MRRGVLTALAVLGLLLGATTSAAHAVTSVLAVNTTTDRSLTDNPEACSDEIEPASFECPLRAAAELASEILATGADQIEIFLPADEYRLSPGNGPVSLGNRQKTPCAGGNVMCPVSLVGEGPGKSVIDGQNGTGLLHTIIESPSVTVEGLTLRNGKAENGGAINGEFKVPLTLRDVEITEDEATKEGGGLWALGPTAVYDSSIDHNSAIQSGAGVWSSEFGITLVRTSVTENETITDGGGLTVEHGPGSVYDSTIAGNKAKIGGALFLDTAEVGLHFSTLSDNTSKGGAIDGSESGSISLEGSIVSGNSPSQCQSNVAASAVGANIVHGANGCAFSGSPPGTEDPGLGAPVAAGLGEVLPLLFGSPAVNAGGSTCTGAGPDTHGPVDQRLLARPQGSGCDLGAVEAGADAGVSLAASPGNATVGSPITLTATTSDAGVEASSGTTVTLPIPSGTSFVSAPPGCTFTTGPPASVTCMIGTLAPGQSVRTAVVVRAETAGAAIETATVGHTEADYNPANDSATIASVISPPGAGGPAGGGGPGGGGPGAGSGRAGSTLVGRVLRVDAHGNATVRLSCEAGSTGGCRDALGIYAAKGKLPATIAGHGGAARLGKLDVSVPAGHTVTARVRLAPAAARAARSRGKLAARLLLSVRGAAPGVSSHVYPVTLKQTGRR